MPRFRTGHRVPLNVYDGDRPVFQAHSEQDAERFVALMNLGERVETVTFGEIAKALRVEAGTDVPGHTTDGEWDTFDNFDSDRITRVVMRVLTSPDTPPSVPESPTEPPPATGQRPTTYDLTEGQEFRQAAAEAEQALLGSIDPRDIMRSAGLPTGQPEDDSGPQEPAWKTCPCGGEHCPSCGLTRAACEGRSTPCCRDCPHAAAP